MNQRKTNKDFDGQSVEEDLRSAAVDCATGQKQRTTAEEDFALRRGSFPFRRFEPTRVKGSIKLAYITSWSDDWLC